MARLDAPTPLVAIATAGLPVNLPSASAIKAAPDSWRVETRTRPGCSSAASRISRKLSPGTVYRRLTPARAITSAATYPAFFSMISAIRPPHDPDPPARHRYILQQTRSRPAEMLSSAGRLPFPSPLSGHIVWRTGREERALARADVVVVGCGVIGLTAAICLREAGLDARIVAAELPEATTSSVAAAIWYPYKAYPEDSVLSWGGRTYEVFDGLSGISESGVLMCEGVEIWREPVPDPWWAGAVPRVRQCDEDALPPGYTDGHAFVAPVVEMPVYLTYLMDRFAATGGSIEQRTLSSLDEVDARVVVNCVGLGARDLVGDTSMQPIRGQIV